MLASFIAECQRFPLASVIVFMALLIVGGPLTKAYHKHPEGGVFGPETMFVAGPDKELLVGFWADEFAVEFKNSTGVQNVKQLESRLM